MEADWTAIVKEYAPQAFAVAWRILGDIADAEDVVQDVFLEFHGMQRHRLIHNRRGMILRLAACRAVDRLRKRKPVVPLDGLVLASPGDDPSEEAIGRELEERLRHAIAHMPQREATVFCLRYFENVSYRQIAESLQIGVSAVSTALNKARSKLQTLLIESRQEIIHAERKRDR